MRVLRFRATALMALAGAHCSTPPVSGDASPDALTMQDATPIDAERDASRSDVAPTLDATPDAAPDATPDAAPDAVADAAPDAVADASQDAITVRCGDGTINGSDVCDDNNTMDDDGCSRTCQPEAGWSCSSASPSVCTARCGDGMRVGMEACDDGNRVTETACPDGTATCVGCNADCTMELSLRGDVCGDGRINGMEQCDDGFTVSGDGCSDRCSREFGADCRGTPSACSFTSAYAGPVQSVTNTNPLPTILQVRVGASCRVADVQTTHQWSVEHTWSSDLVIELLAPSATALLHNLTGDATLIGPYTFARAGAAWAPTGGVYPAGTYAAPSLDSVIGSRAYGAWMLRVRDLGAADDGEISAHRLTVTCAPNRAPLVAMHRSCAEIRAANPTAADGVFMIDTDGAGPAEPFNVYCDMVNGGWTLIYSTNATPAMIRTVETVLPMTASQMSSQTIGELATVSRQVHIRTAGQFATRSITSEPSNFAIQSLRVGLTINSNSPLRTSGDPVAGSWSGPMAANAGYLWHTCGPAPFGTSMSPTMYYACNNANGLHVGPTHAAWTRTGPEENIEIYVR